MHQNIFKAPVNSSRQCSLSLAWIRYELAELVTWVQIPEGAFSDLWSRTRVRTPEGALFLYVFVLFYELLRFLEVVEESVCVLQCEFCCNFIG